MLFDLDVMRGIARREFTTRVENHYGEAGMNALKRVLEGLHEGHIWLAYETLSSLTLFVPLDEGVEPDLGHAGVRIPANQLSQFITSVGTLRANSDGTYQVWTDAVDPIMLGSTSVVYNFTDADYFVIDGQLERVENPTPFPSMFGLPTFVDLQAALDHYSAHLARYTTCKVLADCWYGPRRILLANKPEQTMRRSLAQYLKSTLRDHEAIEVREEQIVDESHPVDIKVTWSMPHRLALIEIKWLGNCVNAAGDTISTTSYRDARAREGAQQLVEYLDENRPHAPTHVTVGYLVVFDARRDGIRDIGSEESVDGAEAVAYRATPISFDPEWHLVRTDFAEPCRIFLEPSL